MPSFCKPLCSFIWLMFARRRRKSGKTRLFRRRTQTERHNSSCIEIEFISCPAELSNMSVFYIDLLMSKVRPRPCERPAVQSLMQHFSASAVPHCLWTHAEAGLGNISTTLIKVSWLVRDHLKPVQSVTFRDHQAVKAEMEKIFTTDYLHFVEWEPFANSLGYNLQLHF